ncbi:NAD(P)-binding protein [Tothia fuscella]|uniref:NAD(P)-binding protein n=1 Tax=Tothia fuscella TaxID=1048955 RepID=A0A9P4U3E5_9PEZI|nr:NAD(P)-binding protein [Tothia fuscella]
MTLVAAAAEHVKNTHGHLDILVNNAGVAGDPWKGNETLREKFEYLYNTNVFGTAVNIDAFIPLIKVSKAPAPGRRIVMVSSGLGSLASTLKNEYPEAELFVPYSTSKTALNSLALHYMQQLKEDKSAVVVVCPGHCSTNLNEYVGARDPRDGAMELYTAATQGGMEMSGKWIRSGEELRW